MLLDKGAGAHGAPVPYIGHIVLECSALACYVAQSQGATLERAWHVVQQEQRQALLNMVSA